MSKIGTKEVKRLAELAKITLTDEEVASLSVQLGDILDYVDQLDKADTANVEPTSQVTGLVDVCRDDEVTPSALSREELLSNAPSSEDGYIKVRRVL